MIWFLRWKNEWTSEAWRNQRWVIYYGRQNYNHLHCVSILDLLVCHCEPSSFYACDESWF